MDFLIFTRISFLLYNDYSKSSINKIVRPEMKTSIERNIILFICQNMNPNIKFIYWRVPLVAYPYGAPEFILIFVGFVLLQFQFSVCVVCSMFVFRFILLAMDLSVFRLDDFCLPLSCLWYLRILQDGNELLDYI